MKKVLFTPRLASTDERLRMHISLMDIIVFEEKGYILITDLDTGKTYRAERAACGFACRCDALVTSVED